MGSLFSRFCRYETVRGPDGRSLARHVTLMDRFQFTYGDFSRSSTDGGGYTSVNVQEAMPLKEFQTQVDSVITMGKPKEEFKSGKAM